MNLRAFLSLVAVASTQAFAPLGGSNGGSKVSTQLRAEIGDSGVSFEHVAREWRCKVRLAISLASGVVIYVDGAGKGILGGIINCISSIDNLSLVITSLSAY